jgi:hypothetical protein
MTSGYQDAHHPVGHAEPLPLKEKEFHSASLLMLSGLFRGLIHNMTTVYEGLECEAQAGDETLQI